MWSFILICKRHHLLLASGVLGLGLLSSALGTDAGVALQPSSLAQGGVGVEALLLGGDLAGLLNNGGRIDNGEGGGDADLRGSSAVSSAAVALLGGLGVLGEDDQAGEVGGQARLVQLERLLAAVAATVVNGDADSAGNLAGDASSLQKSPLEHAPHPGQIP